MTWRGESYYSHFASPGTEKRRIYTGSHLMIIASHREEEMTQASDISRRNGHSRSKDESEMLPSRIGIDALSSVFLEMMSRFRIFPAFSSAGKIREILG